MAGGEKAKSSGEYGEQIVKNICGNSDADYDNIGICHIIDIVRSIHKAKKRAHHRRGKCGHNHNRNNRQ